MATPRAKPAAKLVSTNVELARILGITPKTLWEWSQLPKAPQKKRGKWLVDEWLSFSKTVGTYGLKALRDGGVTPGATGSDPKQPLSTLPIAELDRLKKVEDLLKARLANQEKRESLVQRRVVEEHLRGLVQRAVALMRQLELELPPKLEGLTRPEIEARLQESFDDLRRHVAMLSEELPRQRATEQPQPQQQEVARAD